MKTVTKELTGRELDAAIAREVFNYPDVRTDHLGDLVYGIRTDFGIAPWDSRHGHRIAYFCTEIGAAWSIVEHLQKHGFEFKLAMEEGGIWKADFFNLSFPGGYGRSGSCRSAPEAICRAALDIESMQ